MHATICTHFFWRWWFILYPHIRVCMQCMLYMKSKCLLRTVQHLVCICVSVLSRWIWPTRLRSMGIIPSTLTRRKRLQCKHCQHSTLHHRSLIGNFETGNFFLFVSLSIEFCAFLGFVFVHLLFSFVVFCLLARSLFHNAISLQIDLAERPLFSYQTEFYRCYLINTNTHTHWYRPFDTPKK